MEALRRTTALWLLLSCSLTGCAYTGHATQRSTLGIPARTSQMLAVIDAPGPVEVETVDSADWVAAREGLINLSDPRAKAAGLTDGPEPIRIYFHVLRHPKFGVFLVDTGVERALRDGPAHAAVRGALLAFLLEGLTIIVPLGDYISKLAQPLAGVFLTHLHPDHVAGMNDVPRGTPIYAGPGEATHRARRNRTIRADMDREFAGHAPISEWHFVADPDRRFAGILDVFGDGSVWALFTPGHTDGSTTYLVRTPSGAVLLTGDTCHTAWGWTHDVEPGFFTRDHAENRRSLTRLIELVREHPSLSVRLGHQPLPATSP